VLEVRVWRFNRVATRREISSIWAASSSSVCSVTPAAPCEQLDRAVVVCRTEPTRDDEQVVSETFAERGLEIGRFVADDRDARRSMPSRSSEAARTGPLRSCRSPRTSSEPDATMAARSRTGAFTL